jgi:hypothetical protein
MWSVFISLVVALRAWGRSRPALHLEILALRHQLQILERLLFVLVMLAHERRRVVHGAATEHPTAAWTAQQLRDAFPWDRAPRFLIRVRDHAFDEWAQTAKTMGITEVPTTRFIGSARRECLDHVIVFNARGLDLLMKRYCDYYEQSRTHLSLSKDAPDSSPDRRAGRRTRRSDPASPRTSSSVQTPRSLTFTA